MNIWHGKKKVFLNSFESGFHGFIVLFGNTKDVLSYKIVLFWEINANYIDKK